MRVILIILSILIAAYVVFLGFNYMDKFTSIRGQVYLTGDENDFRILSDLKIYLISSKIQNEIKELKEEYEPLILPLEKEYRRLKAEYDIVKEEARKEEILYKTYEYVTDQKRSELKEKVEEILKKRDKTYEKYMSVRQQLNGYEMAYNKSLSDLINSYVVLETTTDENGRFIFKKVEKNDYFLYAIYGNFLKKYVWFEHVTADEPVDVSLVKENLSSIYR